MHTFDTEKAKLEYNKAKDAPHSLCLITTQIVNWIIKQFKFWAQDTSSFYFKSWETRIIPVKWKDLLQNNWSDVQQSIQAVLKPWAIEKAA